MEAQAKGTATTNEEGLDWECDSEDSRDYEVDLRHLINSTRQYHERHVVGSRVTAFTPRREPNTPTLLGTAPTDESMMDPYSYKIVIQDTDNDKKRKRISGEKKSSTQNDAFLPPAYSRWDERRTVRAVENLPRVAWTLPSNDEIRSRGPGLCGWVTSQRKYLQKEWKTEAAMAK
jgi:hypothetical protein